MKPDLETLARSLEELQAIARALEERLETIAAGESYRVTRALEYRMDTEARLTADEILFLRELRQAAMAERKPPARELARRTKAAACKM